MKKKIKRKEPIRLTGEQRKTRQKVYHYQAKKREAWAEFMKTPEGKEVIKKRKKAERLAGYHLKKNGFSLKDLRPFKYFHEK